jgi:hypothetical protein
VARGWEGADGMARFYRRRRWRVKQCGLHVWCPNLTGGRDMLVLIAVPILRSVAFRWG